MERAPSHNIARKLKQNVARPPNVVWRTEACQKERDTCSYGAKCLRFSPVLACLENPCTGAGAARSVLQRGIGPTGFPLLILHSRYRGSKICFHITVGFTYR